MYDNEEGDPADLREETTTVATRPTAPAAPGTQVDGFGTRALTTTGEIQQTALAAKVTAEVQAKCIMAMRFPRNIDDFRVALLTDCKRRSFAETTRYALPRGKCQECKGNRKIDGVDCWKCGGSGQNIIRGWTIRFAEAALQKIRNVGVESCVTADDNLKQVTKLIVVDYETNYTIASEFITEKTVERKWLKKGQVALDTRLNSYGDRVYLLVATEEDFRSKLASNKSKARRDAALQLIPPDIKEDALEIVYATLASETAADPAAARKKIVDKFAELGVKPTDLVAYLGHDVGACSPAQLQTLREFYSAIKEGRTSWKKIMEDGDELPEAAKPGEPDAAPKSTTGGIKEKLKAQAAATASPGYSPSTAPSQTAQATTTPSAQPTGPSGGRRPNPDVLHTDEEVAQLVADGKITIEPPKARPGGLTDATRKALDGRLVKLHGVMTPESQVSAIDSILGNVGLESIADVSENMAVDAIRAIDAELQGKKGKK